MVKAIVVVVLMCLLRICWGQQGLPLHPVRTDDKITVDGILSEPDWATETWTNFLQVYPRIGALPTERTSIRMIYDDNALYVGIVAYDSLPGAIIATGLERDVYYSSDDHICLALDTYNDKRQGILISSNVLSARFDEEVFDNGNGFNSAFNTFWNVKAVRNENGYVMEFQIPFSSLRFEQTQNVVMGFKVIRYIKRRNEYDIFPLSDPNVANAVWRINNSQEIVFKDLNARRPFYLIPYSKVDYRESKAWNDDKLEMERSGTFLSRNHYVSHRFLDKVISNVGFDLKYGISKNFTLDATMNTDFAQAESDNRIFNFTRFAVNLPEKRNFFLESKDYLGFSTGSGMLLFNSRAIGIENGQVVPIIGGIRLSGKTNGLQIGFLNLQTSAVSTMHVEPQNFGILRMRQELWQNGSYVGAILTNRISTSGHTFNHQTAGVDVLRRFRDNKWLAGLNVGLTNSQGIPFELLRHGMANLNLSRVAALGYNQTTSLEYAGENFRPSIGFAPDSAYYLINSTNGYTWKWNGSEKRNLFWITNSSNYKYRIVNHTHESIYTELEVGTSDKSGATVLITPFTGREFLPYDWNFARDISIPSAFYLYAGLRLRHDSRQTGRLNYSVIGQTSGFYGGTRLNLLFNGYYAINRNFRITYKYEHNNFKWPTAFSLSNNSKYQSNLLSIGLAYTQSIYFSLKALVQFDDVSKTIGSNFRLRFNPKEGTDLYIVYNPRLNTQFLTPENSRSLMIDQQTLIIKFSKAFAL